MAEKEKTNNSQEAIHFESNIKNFQVKQEEDIKEMKNWIRTLCDYKYQDQDEQDMKNTREIP